VFDISNYIILPPPPPPLLPPPLPQAILWLKETYFYQRVKKCPSYYGIYPSGSGGSSGGGSGGGILSETELDNKLKDLCIARLQDLAFAGIIEFVDGYVVRPRIEAVAMTRHVIRFITMATLCQLGGDTSLHELLLHLCGSEELNKVLVRGEKGMCCTCCMC